MTYLGLTGTANCEFTVNYLHADSVCSCVCMCIHMLNMNICISVNLAGTELDIQWYLGYRMLIKI